MVITDVNQVTYNGDGITTAFPFTFKIIDASNIKLILIAENGLQTEITSDYYVDVENNTVYYPGYAPGSEPPEADQPAKLQVGEKLEIYRWIPINQLADLGEKWPFAVIEAGLDKLTMLLQDIYGWVGRNLINKVTGGTAWDADNLPISNVGGPFSLTDAATKDYVDRLVSSIIAGGGRVIPFDNVAQMKSGDLGAGMVAVTLGYYDINDGGAAAYNIRVAGLSETDDGGSIIILDNGNVAELITDGTVNVKQFGAKGNANYLDLPNKVYYSVLESGTEAPYYDNVGKAWYVSAVFTDEGIYQNIFDKKYYYIASPTEAPYYDNVNGAWYVSAVFTDEGTYTNNGKHYVDSAFTTEAPYHDNVGDKWYETATYTDKAKYYYNNKYYYASSATEASYYDNVAKRWYVSATYSNEATVKNMSTDVWYYNAVLSAEADDDTDKIQKAVNFGNVIVFQSGNYLVSVVNNNDPAISVPSNKNIVMDENSSVIMNGNALTQYSIFHIDRVSNITIQGGKIVGDRNVHTGTSGEWGHCIKIVGASNIKLSKLICRDGWGDGISISRRSYVTPTDIVIENCTFDNNRRQGMSVVCVDGLSVYASRFINTNGTSPQAGIDFEPDNATHDIKRVVLNDIYTYNNAGYGILIAYQKDSVTPVDISINDWYNNSNGLSTEHGGLYFAGNAPSGKVVVNNFYTENNYGCAIKFRHTYVGAEIFLNNIHIHNPNRSNATSSYSNNYIVVSGEAGTYHKNNGVLGGIYIDGLTMTADDEVLQTLKPIRVIPNDLTCKNLSIKNVIKLDASSEKSFDIRNTYNFELQPSLGLPTHLDANNSDHVAYSRITTEYQHAGDSAGVVTLTRALPAGFEFTYLSSPTLNTFFIASDGAPIYPLVADTSVERIKLPPGVGNRIKFKYDGTNFCVIDMIGNITVESYP